jgi:hypothetical protein
MQKTIDEIIRTRDSKLRLAAFAVMMQHGDGLMAKSPDYMVEKFLLCMELPEQYLEGIMDNENRFLFREWKKRWY